MTLKERLRIRIPEEDNELVLDEVLETAKGVILANLYPFEEDTTGKEMPTKYNSLLLDIATEMYNKKEQRAKLRIAKMEYHAHTQVLMLVQNC